MYLGLLLLLMGCVSEDGAPSQDGQTFVRNQLHAQAEEIAVLRASSLAALKGAETQRRTISSEDATADARSAAHREAWAKLAEGRAYCEASTRARRRLKDMAEGYLASPLLPENGVRESFTGATTMISGDIPCGQISAGFNTQFTINVIKSFEEQSARMLQQENALVDALPEGA